VNRITKATPWGTIRHEYDAENRLVRRGDVAYTNDRDGNTLTEKGTRYEARYEYNGRNRMTYSEVTNHADRTHNVTAYAYDALGRRTLTQSAAGQALRTVYDGKSFEVIREGETFRDGSLTTQFTSSVQARGGSQLRSNTLRSNTLRSNEPTGERYRWIGEGGTAAAAEDGYSVQGGRYGARGVTLYGNGEAVAVSYSSSAGNRSSYLGKDVMGSVRSVTGDMGSIEDRYEYDAFGKPYRGDLSGGMNMGYTGKPYDTATGLYNYGYRDYRPQAARFTTVDPVRDGNNWFAYVNNDPVNWIDLWGLCTSDNDFDSYMDFFEDSDGIVFYGEQQNTIFDESTKNRLEGVGIMAIGTGIIAISIYGFSQGLDMYFSLQVGSSLFAIGFAELVTGKSSPYTIKDAITPAEKAATDALRK